MRGETQFPSLFLAGKAQPEVFLSENPFVCNCEMEWVPEANNGARHPRVADVSAVECALTRLVPTISQFYLK